MNRGGSRGGRGSFGGGRGGSRGGGRGGRGGFGGRQNYDEGPPDTVESKEKVYISGWLISTSM